MTPEERLEVAEVVGEVVAKRIEPLSEDIRKLKTKVYEGNGEPSLMSKVAELRGWAKLLTAIVLALLSIGGGLIASLLP